MKKLIISAMLVVSTLYSQSPLDVEEGHPAYTFLERMSTLNFISGYNDFEYPKSRAEIANHLKLLYSRNDKLNRTDKELLRDLLKEFDYEINLTDGFYKSLSENDLTEYLFSDNKRYLYKSTDNNGNSFFANASVEMSLTALNTTNEPKFRSVKNFFFGAEIKGSLNGNIGFFAKAYNGKSFGPRDAASMDKRLKYNYKFNEYSSILDGNNFIDDTEGYLSVYSDNIKFKIGRFPQKIGYGKLNTIIGSQTALFDQASFRYKYKFFSFSYIHGKMLHKAIISDSLTDALSDKYFVYHRFGFDFSKHLQLGFGETVMYSGRSLDLSYLNPFSFFKSIEHYNRDRENPMMFIDFRNQSIEGLTLFGEFLIDDIHFDKIGSGWYGNKTLLNIGAHANLLYPELPVDVKFQYIRIEPYVYTHKINSNSYTHLGGGLADPLNPNSSNLFLNIEYMINYRTSIGVDLFYSIRGKNDVAFDINYGGSADFGHREKDGDKINFLDGIKETTKSAVFYINLEPVKDYKLNILINYNSMISETGNSKSLAATTAVKIKF